jgi:hypothetical protein
MRLVRPEGSLLGPGSLILLRRSRRTLDFRCSIAGELALAQFLTFYFTLSFAAASGKSRCNAFVASMRVSSSGSVKQRVICDIDTHWVAARPKAEMPRRAGRRAK